MGVVVTLKSMMAAGSTGSGAKVKVQDLELKTKSNKSPKPLFDGPAT